MLSVRCGLAVLLHAYGRVRSPTETKRATTKRGLLVRLKLCVGVRNRAPVDPFCRVKERISSQQANTLSRKTPRAVNACVCSALYLSFPPRQGSSVGPSPVYVCRREENYERIGA